MVSPSFISREGLTFMPLIITLPFLHSSEARLRVLYRRTAKSHLSMRTPSAILFPFIKECHGLVYSNGRKAFNDFNRSINHSRKFKLFLFIPFAEHIIHLLALPEIITYALSL